jgi:hypothetical protein
MTSRTRLGLAISPVLVLSAAVLLVAADLVSPRFADPPPRPVDLTVHEWGTFTSVAGEDGSAIEWDALGCKDDLPGFVNDFGYRGFKWRLRGTVRMETPVVYFYSPREVEVDVKVSFPKGLITEWYPQATYRVSQSNGPGGSLRLLQNNLNGIDTSLRTVTGAIEWNHIKVQPHTMPLLPLEGGASRYYAARETDAAPIAVGDQHEKFLFYRGVGRFPIPLSARLSADGTILVENAGRDAVPSVILFENQAGRLGYRTLGPIEGKTTLDRPSLDATLPQLRYDLENILVDQGLFLKEAQAMVATWSDSWFEEGARLIYIMPAASLDGILPLQVEPAPPRSARVFVGRIELVTPEITRSVEDAVTNGDWPAVDRYRRFLEPILRRVHAESPKRATDVRRRLQQHMDESSAAGANCR